MSDVLVIPTKDPNVVLRQLARPEDDAIYHEAVSYDPAHLSQFGDVTAEKYQTIEAVTRARLTAGPVLRMGVWKQDGETETFVAFVKATPNEAKEEAEIGYWVDSRHLRQGFGTLAANALARYMAERYPRVFAKVVPGNEASAGVLQKSGFTQTGTNEGKLIFDFVG